MTWNEVLKSNHKTVIVQSYGYVERSFINSHFEPFSHLREFVFKISRDPGWESLDHEWLYLGEPESELTFDEKDGKLYVFDPDLWAKP